MAVNRPNVDLHIEALVLRGFPPGGSQAIAAAIEAELGRLLAVEGLPASVASGASMGTLDAGAFKAGVSDRPSALGARIARSVYQSLEPRK